MTILIVIFGMNWSCNFFTKQQKITVHNNMFYSAGKMFYSAVKVLQSSKKFYSVENYFTKR